MSDDEAQFDEAVDATIEQVAFNAQRMDILLETLHRRLAQNYIHVPVAIGACMIVGGFVHIWLRSEFVFSLTATVFGALIILLALFFHHRATQNLVVFGQSLVEIDKTRNEHAQKLAVVEQLFQNGFPSALSLQHLRVLLGESAGHQSSGDIENNGTRPENN